MSYKCNHWAGLLLVLANTNRPVWHYKDRQFKLRVRQGTFSVRMSPLALPGWMSTFSIHRKNHLWHLWHSQTGPCVHRHQHCYYCQWVVFSAKHSSNSGMFADVSWILIVQADRRVQTHLLANDVECQMVLHKKDQRNVAGIVCCECLRCIIVGQWSIVLVCSVVLSCNILVVL